MRERPLLEDVEEVAAAASIRMKSLTRDQRKEKLRRMVEQLVTPDNAVRDQIWNGTFKP